MLLSFWLPYYCSVCCMAPALLYGHVCLPAGLQDPGLHHIVVNSWDHGVDAEQNVVLISIASAIDPTLAPAGKHVLHAYLPATEPFHLWENLQRGSPEYLQLKEERSQVGSCGDSTSEVLVQLGNVDNTGSGNHLCDNCYGAPNFFRLAHA